MSTLKKRYTHAEWIAEAKRRFGDKSSAWKFKCPSCGYVASVQDWEDLNARDSAGFACIGRFTDPPAKKEMGDQTGGPCNYTGGGLFKINPVIVIIEEDGIVTEEQAFDFADSGEVNDGSSAGNTTEV